jgi:succinoglycan biosynthesis protein ExoA
MGRPFITVVIPTYNEEATVVSTLQRLMKTSYPRDRIEFLVVDGGSADRTVTLAREMAASLPHLRVVHNPKRLQGAAMNLAVAEADPLSEWLIRCDCHAEYPEDFIATVMSRVASLSEDYAGVVYAVRCATDGPDCFRNATGWSFGSLLGGGNSAYRTGTPVGPIDHGWHGTFNREILRRVGGYDEDMIANEDVDLSLKFGLLGYRLWIAGDIPVGYISRSTVGTLWRQFCRYGRGRVLLMERHRRVFKLRHAPMVAILPWTVLVIMTTPIAPWLWLTMFFYGLVLAAAGLQAASSTRNPCLLLLPVALAVMHFSWSYGFITEMSRRVAKKLGAQKFEGQVNLRSQRNP